MAQDLPPAGAGAGRRDVVLRIGAFIVALLVAPLEIWHSRGDVPSGPGVPDWRGRGRQARRSPRRKGREGKRSPRGG